MRMPKLEKISNLNYNCTKAINGALAVFGRYYAQLKESQDV